MLPPQRRRTPSPPLLRQRQHFQRIRTLGCGRFLRTENSQKTDRTETCKFAQVHAMSRMGGQGRGNCAHLVVRIQARCVVVAVPARQPTHVLDQRLAATRSAAARTLRSAGGEIRESADTEVLLRHSPPWLRHRTMGVRTMRPRKRRPPTRL